MTPEQLAAIKARADKATAGPWFGYEERDCAAEGHAVSTGPQSLFVVGLSNQDALDVDFIAHARTDLPRLLAEVERLRGVADETYRLVRLARHWIGDNAPASISKALDDYVFTHPMKSAAEGGE